MHMPSSSAASPTGKSDGTGSQAAHVCVCVCMCGACVRACTDLDPKQDHIRKIIKQLTGPLPMADNDKSVT